MGFSPKSFIDSEASMSPTSILETKPFSIPNNHNKKSYWGNGDSTPIGLGIVDALSKENCESKTFNQISRMVLFGSQLKIQIPPLESPKSVSPRLFEGCFSPSELELSEDYTCVISYGPNPKKTHIFDNCVLEKCGDGFVASKKGNCFSNEESSGYSSEDFLSFCHGCRKSLGLGKDIFMYRGERAFCSHECRQQEMISDAEETESCFEDLLDLL